MPQMAPMSWLLLFFFFLISFILFINLNYFSMFFQPKHFHKSSALNNKTPWKLY